MRLIYSILPVFICHLLLAQAPQNMMTVKEHLIAVNSNWEFYPIQNESQLMSFSNIDERISFHFQHVIEKLKDRSLVDDDLAQNRDEIITELQFYAERRRFPINTRHLDDKPYFIDDFGTACAVANLMIESGNKSLALQIQREHNFDFIRDISTSGVAVWAEMNGVSVDELALIQPASYSPPDPSLVALSSGLNGTVKSLVADEELNRLYFSGDFNFISEGEYCAGLGYYQDDQVYCLNPPSHVRINSLIINNEHQLFASGIFTEGGQSFPLTIRVDNEWELIAVPNRPGAEGIEVIFTSGPNPEMILVIQPEGQDQIQEVWFQESTEEWSHMATINGKIHCTHSNGYEFLAGEFNYYIDHLQDNLIQPSSGIMYTHFYPIGEYFMGSIVADSLPEVIQQIDGTLSQMYIAGTGDDSYPNHYLSTYSNGESSALITYTGAPLIEGVRDFHFLNENEVLLATDTYVDMGGYTYGFGLGIYNINTGYVEPKAYLDSVPLNLEEMNGRIFIGGPFTQNNYSPMPFLAEMDEVTGIHENFLSDFSVYPNPSRTTLSLSNIPTSSAYSIYDSYGRIVCNKRLLNSKIDISQLVPGSYFLRIISDSIVRTVPFAKE